jgi:pentatricopeptide repeat protein
VVELFHDMLETGVKPDMATRENVMAVRGRSGFHGDATELYFQGSQLDDAVKAYMDMRKSRFDPDELGCSTEAIREWAV